MKNSEDQFDWILSSLNSQVNKLDSFFSEIKNTLSKDVESYLKDVLESLGCPYTINSQDWSSVVIINDGVSLKGSYDQIWQTVTYSAVINWNGKTFSRGVLAGVPLPYLKDYQPVLIKAIDILKKISKDLTSRVKTHRKSNLLSKLILSTLEDLYTGKITDEIKVDPVERYDYNANEKVYEKDKYTLTKEIIPGLRVGYVVEPDNYKTKCAQFVKLLNKVPATFSQDDWSAINCHMTSTITVDRYKTGGGNWAESPEKMKYVDVLPTEITIPEALPVNEKIVSALTEMGFIFSFDGTVLNVQLSKDFVLCRNAKKVYFKTTEKESGYITFSDDKFILILKIIAKASTRNGYLTPKALGFNWIGEYPDKFYDGMLPAIREFIPPMSDISPEIIYGEYMITFSPSLGFQFSHTAANALWTFLGNVDAILEVRNLQSKKANGSFVEVRCLDDSWIRLNRMG